ncbi:helix-turn-helix transcriptional regulator [Micromonospora sp. NPDC049679]|uniref:helix-turn-helix domain-containing protein n=1 Tax=Micromonospora sp. NPDC049679 TaxID=3155920 RepID=UPI0033C716CB
MPRRPSGDTAIGQRIRDRRELLQWSVRHAADRAGVAPSTWSRIEHGHISADNRFTLASIAEALRCPVTDLTGLPQCPIDREKAETGGAVYETVRATIEADLDYPPIAPPAPYAALSRELDLVCDLRARCQYTAAAHRLPALIRGLHSAAYGADRERALRGLILAAYTASFVIRYTGHPGSACLIADRTRQAAEMLEHPVMSGLAAFSRAHAAAGMALYPRTLQIAERAVCELRRHAREPEAPELLGQLLMTQAYALYGIGRTDDALEPVAEARAIAERTGESPALRLMFGPTNINFWRISMEADGEDPSRAVDIARRTRPHLVESTSRQVAFYLDTGRALVRLGQDAEALRMLLTAERLAPQRMRAPLVTETVRGLLERARRGGTGWTELRGLCERIGVGS